MRKLLVAAFALALLALIAILAVDDVETSPRIDGAELLPIALDGSLQNAAWSPTGEQIAFTRFRSGYNKPPADIAILHLASGSVRFAIKDGANNVSQPGSTWNARTGSIIFSSDQTGRDEVFTIGADGKADSLNQLTGIEGHVAFEPSWSPDGRSFVYEMHRLDEEGNGVIALATTGSRTIEELTRRGDDCRQPNWSPAGDIIIYQKKEGNDWDIWVYELGTKTHRRLTDFPGDRTDATFSPDGRWVVYSGDSPELQDASLFAVPTTGGRPIQVTHAGVYDGAPSWSPDGKFIAFESATPKSPRFGLSWISRARNWFREHVDGERETKLWIIKTPDEVRQQLCVPGSACRGGRPSTG